MSKELFEKMIKKIKSQELRDALAVQSILLKSVSDFMSERGVIQMLPVVVSPITDPLAHTVVDASIDYYGHKLQLTKSMILHKQIALMSPYIDAIYIVSPNVRLETEDLRDSDRHLIEFTQVDIEFKHGEREKFIPFMEDMMVRIISDVKRECKEELARFGRGLEVPKRPFKRFEMKEIVPKCGRTPREAEAFLYEREKQMFWILDHVREFYDREEEGYHYNYDLIYPEGFGEGASGAEREHEHEKILKKIAERRQKSEEFGVFTQLAERGLLSRTVGAGFGVERLVKYLCGVKEIEQVVPFSKKPATPSLL